LGLQGARRLQAVAHLAWQQQQHQMWAVAPCMHLQRACRCQAASAGLALAAVLCQAVAALWGDQGQGQQCSLLHSRQSQRPQQQGMTQKRRSSNSSSSSKSRAQRQWPQVSWACCLMMGVIRRMLQLLAAMVMLGVRH
jgi:hypothetical protein